jgi:glycosyltransferase involved in cell wall biosynthesis
MQPYSFVIADPGLHSASGHNFAALEVISAAIFPTVIGVYGHRDVDGSLFARASGAQRTVGRHFREYLYDSIEVTDGAADLSEYIGLLGCEYEGLLLELRQKHEQCLVLHHTMDWPHLIALAIANERASGFASSIRHIVFLSFSPGLADDLKIKSSRRYLGYRMGLSRLGRQSNVGLFAGGVECQRALTHVVPEYGPYPIHPCFYLDESRPAAPRGQQSERLTVSVAYAKIGLFLGDAKAEKGFLELPSLAKDVGEVIGREAELVVAYNLNAQLESPELREAAKALDDLAGQEPRLRLSNHYQSNSELHETLERCDFLVLNYDPAIYADKSSGLLWLAAKCDTPVVAIGRSWLTREGERLGVPLCVVGSTDDLIRKIKKDGTLVFERKAADLEYRKQIFAPLGQFLEKAATDAFEGDHRRRVLFIDGSLPDASRSGGGRAALSEIRLHQALGFAVDFVSLSGDDSQERAQELAALGVTVHGDGHEALVRLGREFDHVFATRFNVAEAAFEQVRKYAPQAKVILNVADLHFLREGRRAELEANALRVAEADAIRDNELGVMRRVDLVLTYSDVEKKLIESELGHKVRVALCPWVENIRSRPAPFEEREGIAFLGGFAHAPNVDAVVWFVENMMPLLRAELPGVKFYVYGADMPPAVAALESEDVSILGFVPDVAEVYDRHRIFAVPLRYGAGLKGKVACALARGVPCVLSPIAAEGFGDVPARVAESPEQWVKAIRELHEDQSAWEAMSASAVVYGAMNFSFERGLERFRRIVSSLEPGPKTKAARA